MTTVDSGLTTVDIEEAAVDIRSEAGGAQGVAPPPGPAQVSASRLAEPLTSFETAPATVTDEEIPEVPRAARDEDAVRYWTGRILTAPRPAGDIPLRYRTSGDHPEYADHATTMSDLRIALGLACGTPIEYVDRNGYDTLDYLYMQRAAATRMGISMAAYRRQVADGT